MARKKCPLKLAGRLLTTSLDLPNERDETPVDRAKAAKSRTDYYERHVKILFGSTTYKRHC